jgi:hypothetical protein
MLKDFFRRLVCRGLCDDRDGQASHAKTVQNDGGVVEIAQNMHAKGIDHTVADQDCGVYAHRLSCSGCPAGLDRCGCRNQLCASETDTSSDGKLIQRQF